MIIIFQWFEGTVRDLFISMDVIQTFIAFQIALFFLFRIFKSNRGLKINFGWCIVFLCLGIMSSLSIFRVYYLTPSILSEFEKIFNVIGFIPAAAIVFMLEMLYQQFRKTKYIITLAGVITLIVSLLIAPEYTSNAANIYLFLLFFFTISFFYKLIKISSGTVKLHIIIFTLSFYALMVGNIMAYPGRFETWEITSTELNYLVLIGKIFKTC